MTGYIILASLLALALACCAWLADQLQKCEKALSEEKRKLPLMPSYDVMPINTARGEIKEIAAELIDRYGAPSDRIEQELAHKLAARLPEFWTLEKHRTGRRGIEYCDFGTEYIATIRVCTQENERIPI